ncbi:MAG: phosphatase PAP2 family protein [Bacteroidales bacterium]|nr:phosphatase PAP2 family protein [Bacteroidales bacterium]
MEAIDSQLFLFLNGLHTEWLDTVMVAITEMWLWIPLYILLLYMVFKQYGKRGWWILLAVAVLILCSDQLSAHVCKPLFHRLRPCFNPDLEGLVHLPKGLPGGRYGFVSSHAANTFAVATFLTAVLRKSYRSIGWWLFAWALVSSYSRIYIGVHYPGDILAGAVLGVLIGLIIAMIVRRLLVSFEDHLDGGADVEAPEG